MISAKILMDSIYNGVRLTTVEVTFPRYILAEFNTHRMVSKNLASSRAIPHDKLVSKIKENPHVPKFRHNKPGMQGAEFLPEVEQAEAKNIWLQSLKTSMDFAELLSKKFNIHKQYTNRMFEFGMYTTAIATATDWDNLFALRFHSAAEPNFMELASILWEEFKKSTPTIIGFGDWHLPFVTIPDATSMLSYEDIIEYLTEFDNKNGTNLSKLYNRDRYEKYYLQDVAVGRCAKVSYLNHDTQKIDHANDIRLALQLSTSFPGHWSPFEHIATPAYMYDMRYEIEQLYFDCRSSSIKPKTGEQGYCGNLREWKQYRKFFDNENVKLFTGQIG